MLIPEMIVDRSMLEVLPETGEQIYFPLAKN